MSDIEPKSEGSIVVIGVGGCGCSSIHRLIETNPFDDIHFLAINTDARSLSVDKHKSSVQIGPQLTKGLGAGAIPEVGQQAAIESEQAISEAISGANIIFLTAGMGGGTGTGAAPEVARIAAAQNIPVIAIVTRPFAFEGAKKARCTSEGIERLLEYAQSVVVLPNDNLGKVLGQKTRLVNAFEQSNRIIHDTLSGLGAMISTTGIINIDLNDFKSVISTPGRAVMGIACKEPDESLETMLARALQNPLIEAVDLSKAQGAIVNIIARQEIDLEEYSHIGETVHDHISEKANVIIGLTIDPDITHELEVLLIATGVPYQQTSELIPRYKLQEFF